MQVFKNFAETTLAVAYTAGDGVLDVVDLSVFPDSISYHVVLGNAEKTIFHVNNDASGPLIGVAVENDANAALGDTVQLVMCSQTQDEIKKDQVTKAGFFTFGQGSQYPPKAGQLHLFTDSPHVGRSVATQTDADLWYGLVPAGKLSPGNFFALNQGTSVYSTTGQGATARMRALVEAATEGVHGRYLSVPASAFTRTIGLYPDPVFSATGPARAGAFAMESGTGKIITLGCKFDPTDGARLTEVIYWDDQDTINSVALLGARYHYLSSPLWYRIQRAGSNLVYSASTNKFTLTSDLNVVLNEAITNFFTTEPDRAGFFIANATTDEEFTATFVSWEAVG